MIKFSFFLSFLLIAILILSNSPSVSAAVAAPDRNIVKEKKKISGKTTKKRFLKKKFKTKNRRKNSTRRFNQPQIEGEFEGDAQKREDWFMSQRTYPYTELPADARRRAWLSRPGDVRVLNGNAPATDVQWQSIGPKPTTSFFPGNWGLTSGRVNAIAVSPSNPQLVLIGAATGGVWR